MSRTFIIVFTLITLGFASSASAQIHKKKAEFAPIDHYRNAVSEGRPGQLERVSVPAVLEVRGRSQKGKIIAWRGNEPVLRKATPEDEARYKRAFGGMDQTRDAKIFAKKLVLNAPAKGTREHAIGIDGYSAFEDGKAWGTADGDMKASVKGTVLGIDADTSVSGYAGRKGFEAEASAAGCATLVSGEGKVEAGTGDEDRGLNCHAEGVLFVGAEAKAKTTAGLEFREVNPTMIAKAEVFAGAKAKASGGCAGMFCRAMVEIKGSVEGTAGAGVKLLGKFVVDWKKKTIAMAGEVSGTLGLGGGTSTEIVIDLSKITDQDFAELMQCLADRVLDVALLVMNSTHWLENKAFTPAGEWLSQGASDARSWARRQADRAAAGAAQQLAGLLGSAGAGDGSSVSRAFDTTSARPTSRTPFTRGEAASGLRRN